MSNAEIAVPDYYYKTGRVINGAEEVKFTFRKDKKGEAVGDFVDVAEEAGKWDNYTSAELDELDRLENETPKDLVSAINTQSRIQSIHAAAQTRALGKQSGSNNGGIVTALNKISNNTAVSDKLSSLENSLNASVDAFSKAVAQGLANNSTAIDKLRTASKPAGGNDGDKISNAIGSLNENLAKMSDNLSAIKENGGKLADIETERHEYETKPQTIRDLDGESVANISPRDAQTIKNASEARIATDENNFNVGEDEINGLFPEFPDITALFDFVMPSKIDEEIMK